LRSGRIQSRALRAQLRMMLRAYGAQESDCISAAFGHIRPERNHTSPHKRALDF